MNRENYELLSASLLKDMAKKRGIRGLSAMRKSQVVDALVEYDRQKEAHRSCGAHGGFRHAGESFPAFRRGEFRGK